MVKTQRILVSIFLLVFLVGFINAQGCADEGWKGYSKIHENKTITITCTTCSYINFTATNQDQEIFLSNVQMTKSGSTFSYIFLGTDLNSVGNYQLDGYSNLEMPLAVCFDVTMTGNESSLGTYAILLLITILSFAFLIWMNHKFNEVKRKQLYDRIVTGYSNTTSGKDKNLGKVLLYILGYGLLKNLIVFYYLNILFFLIIFLELIEAFGITSLILLFTTILNIYLLSSIVIFMVMFFSFYELIMDLIRDVAKMQRGIVN